MSYAFAQRHGILAVALSPEEVTIASAQPFVQGWESNLVHVLKRPIKRVVANPADIQRYTVEFFRLARSVSGATCRSTWRSPPMRGVPRSTLYSLTGEPAARTCSRPHLLRALVACGWFGIQTWIGGFALYQMLKLWIPSLATLPKIFPDSFGLETGPAICFFLFWFSLW